MIQEGILNPRVLDLLARIRHTNTLVIADWAFPYWPQIETVDLSLTTGIPMIRDVLALLQPNFKVGAIMQAEEFLTHNPQDVVEAYEKTFAGFPHAKVERMAHDALKKRVPNAIGLIRTGDPTMYGNVILQSA